VHRVCDVGMTRVGRLAHHRRRRRRRDVTIAMGLLPTTRAASKALLTVYDRAQPSTTTKHGRRPEEVIRHPLNAPPHRGNAGTRTHWNYVAGKVAPWSFSSLLFSSSSSSSSLSARYVDVLADRELWADRDAGPPPS